eukprot:3937174-Rhodomonas_salina.1
MQDLAARANGALLAEYLTQQSAALNQIEVVQDATTVVAEALDAYSYVAAHSPGFLVTNVSYASVPAGGWDALEHVWRVRAQFHRPPEMAGVLFLSRGGAGAQACALATDVCCLHRMAEATFMGDFGAWVRQVVSPYCPGGLPNATAAAAASDGLLAGLELATWTAGVFDGFHGAQARVPARDTLELDIPQADVIEWLAEVQTAGSPPSSVYTFSVGMLFLRALPAPAVHAVLGQATLQVVASEEITFVGSSQQSYSFLEFLDVSLYEVADAAGGAPLAFAR